MKLAERPVIFIEKCCVHVTPSAMYHVGDKITLLPWQKALIRNIFGWVHPTTRRRRYNHALLYIPKKNGKTLLISCLALYYLLYEEPASEVYSIGMDGAQAGILFKNVIDIINISPVLNQLLKSRQLCCYGGNSMGGYGNRSIVYRGTRSFYRVMSGILEGKHGFNPNLLLVDELHEFQDRHVIDAMEMGMASRAQPLCIYMTTADCIDSGPCHEVYLNAKTPQRTFLPCIYEYTDAEVAAKAWNDPSSWSKVNPSLDHAISRKYLTEMCAVAQSTPSRKRDVLRLHWNVRDLSPTHACRIPWEDWDLCGHGESGCWDDLHEREVAAYGQEVIVGIDLSSTIDITAVAIYVPKTHDVFWHMWLSSLSYRRGDSKGRQFYERWIDEKYITECNDSTIDYEIVAKDLSDINDNYDVLSYAMDRWNYGLFMKYCNNINIDPVGMGFKSMMRSMPVFEQLILSHSLRHHNNPVASWQFRNMTIEIDAAGNMKPNRAKSHFSIDAMSALLVALYKTVDDDDVGDPRIFSLCEQGEIM